MNIDPKQTPKVEETVNDEKEIKTKVVGSFVIKPGLKIWEYNAETGELKLAEVEVDQNKTITLDDVKTGKRMSHNKIKQKDDCLYVMALNKKNAKKKILKSGITLS